MHKYIPLRHACIAGVWLVASAAACAGGLSTALSDYSKIKAEGKTTTFVDIDNDTLLLTRSDRLYTSGARIGQRYTLQQGAQATSFGWRIGQEVYTPSDIKLAPAAISANDHPYAGWLYGGLFKETHRSDGSHINLGIDIGCLGPCSGAEWTQTNLHRVLDQPMPRGWSQQVRNEWGAVLYADVAPVRWTPRDWLDLTPNFHGRFGNIFTDAGAGLTLRAGQLNLLPEQDTWHGFLRLDGRAVAYNASLQGGYFSRNNPRVVRPKRFVPEVELGMMWRAGPYGFSASIVRRGNEIRDLSNASGNQDFARLKFVYAP